MVTAVTAQLPYLPEPLKLKHGPILATVETWSDGTVVAKIPAVALYADADSDTLALDALGEEVLDFAVEVRSILQEGSGLSGPLLLQWRALMGLVDISALE